jgi:hypothetical protein
MAQRRKTERFEVGIGKPHTGGPGLCEVARATGAANVYGKSVYALLIQGRGSFLPAAVAQSPDSYAAS